MISKSIAVFLLLLSVPCLGANVSELPASGMVGLSWVMNVSAKEYAGLSLYRVYPGKIGWFAEAKIGRTFSWRTSDYYENISISEAEGWGDRLLKNDAVHDTYSAGITYVVNRGLFLYSGVGYTASRSYRQYHDDLGILGDNGDYWVDGPNGGSSTNMLVGLIIRAKERTVFHVGYDTSPSGLNLGIGMVGAWPWF